MELNIEEIPDGDTVAKSIFFPKDFNTLRELIWESLFQFPTNKETNKPYGESVIWEKYAATTTDKHSIGLLIAENRREKNPNCSYEGYTTSLTQIIRQIQNSNGHGFDVEHKPEEGIYHAEILYKVDPDKELKKSDKTELKGYLTKVFTTFVANN